ncbi:unnamed protein product, partial [Lymnaea stagnalis]
GTNHGNLSLLRVNANKEVKTLWSADGSMEPSWRQVTLWLDREEDFMLEFLNDGRSLTALDDITIERGPTDYGTKTSSPASSNPKVHSTSSQKVTLTKKTTTFSSPTSRAPNDTT